MLTEIRWSNSKNFMPNKNMYSVWKVYAKSEYICNLKKICYLKVYLMLPKIYTNWKIFVTQLNHFLCLLKNISWFKNSCYLQKNMLIEKI